MKILRIIPIKIDPECASKNEEIQLSANGIVEVEVEINYGFLGLKKKKELWRAFKGYNLWKWAHILQLGDCDITALIDGHIEQLLNNETIEVQPQIL